MHNFIGKLLISSHNLGDIFNFHNSKMWYFKAHQTQMKSKSFKNFKWLFDPSIHSFIYLFNVFHL